MPIQIRMTGPEAEQELGSLCAWLRMDEDIRRHASILLVPADPDPSEMGTAFEVIQLLVTSAFQTLNLALAYSSWRASRPARPQVTIERGDTKVYLYGTEPDTVDVIVRALR